jgi:hypothetical protein
MVFIGQFGLLGWVLRCAPECCNVFSIQYCAVIAEQATV